MEIEKISSKPIKRIANNIKTTMTLNKSHRIFLEVVAVICGITFASSFYALPAIAIMVLFPMVWLSWQNRKLCFVFVFPFYLFMNWEEIPDALRFFEANHMGLGFAVLIWLVHSLFMTTPWVIGYCKNPSLKQAVIRAFVITLVLFVPPLGYFVWLQPITAAGILFPGWGWFGFAFTISLMLLFVALRFAKIKDKKIFACLIVLLLGCSLVVNLTYTKPKTPTGWVAVNTHLGPAPHDYFSLAYREFALMNLAEEGLSQGYKVLIFPENIAVDWMPGTVTQWQALNSELQAKQATIILGAQLDYPDQSFDNVLVTLGVNGGQVLPARQPMPLGLWKPWSKQNYHAHWLGSGKFKIQGIEVAYLICYEQMISWPLLSSFMTSPRPQVVISSANQWFSTYSGYVKQHNVMLANARLFGVPTLTAVNH